MEKNQLNLELGINKLVNNDFIDDDILNYYLFVNYGIIKNLNIGFKTIYCGNFGENEYGTEFFMIYRFFNKFLIGYEYKNATTQNSSGYLLWKYNIEYRTSSHHFLFIGYMPRIKQEKDMFFIFQTKLIRWEGALFIIPSLYWEVYPMKKLGIYLNFNVNFSYILMPALAFSGMGGIIYKINNFRVKLYYKNYGNDIFGIALEYRR
jgi:hypothetical protein